MSSFIEGIYGVSSSLSTGGKKLVRTLATAAAASFFRLDRHPAGYLCNAAPFSLPLSRVDIEVYDTKENKNQTAI
jgi:hypothetical protein